MTKWMRKRLATLLASLMIVAVLAGCSADAKPAAEPEKQPAATQTVDKDAILKEAAVSYFTNLPKNVNLISWDEVKKLIEAKDDSVYFLDIRRPEDFEKEHVDGFVNMPMGAIGVNIDKLPKDKKILVTCYSGQTAGQTIAVLRMAGYNAMSIKSGWKGIGDTELPMIKK